MKRTAALIAESQTLGKHPGCDKLAIVPHIAAAVSEFDCVRFETADEEFSDDPIIGLTLNGSVVDTGEEKGSEMIAAVNLYDAEHHGIGQLWAFVPRAETPGETLGFSLSSLYQSKRLSAERIASYELFAFPDQFQLIP